MKKSKLDFKNPFLLYTGLFLLIGFFVFFWFLYYGKSLLITSDGFEQYYPMLNRFRNLIKNLLAGKGFPFWSWEVSLGGDTIGNYIYFLTDPFFYIAALFPPEHSDIGYGFAIYLRLYFAGIMMMCFLRNRKFSGDRLVIGGLSYALSLWAISASIQAFFLVPLILFPLMVLGVDRLDNQNRPYVLIIGVTLSLITSVYFSYMSALMLALYTIVSFFSLSGEKNARRFLLRTVRLIGCVFVAVCISAP
ncbi:MAG: YfhO family protein, partial [Oscillospiraceae bacterium]|nr:YfhO family protein [Oscillospiraceae bacterium]